MIRIGFIGILCLVYLGGFTQTRKWTLDECIDYGVGESLQMQRQQLHNRNEQLDVRDALLDLFPTVGGFSPAANFNYGRGIDPETNTYTNLQTKTVGGFNLSGGMPVFAGFSRINRFRAAKIARLKGIEETENLANDLAIRIMEAFFDLLYAGESVRILEEKWENTTLQVKKIKREYELGRVPRSDLFDIQAQQATDEYQLIASRNDCSVALVNLKHLMNYGEKEELEIDTASLPVLVTEADTTDIGNVFDQAMKQLPQALAAEYNIRISRLNWQVAKAALYPSLSASGGISFGYYTSQSGDGFWQQVTDKNRIGKSIGINMNIPLFQGLSGRSGVSRAKNSFRDAQLQYQQTEQTVYTEIQKAWLALEAVVQQYKAARKKEAYHLLAYQVGKKRYEQGLITIIEWNTTSDHLLQARYDLLKARLTYVMQKRMVDFYKGVPLQTRIH